ncbi:hypothetical protein TYRP_009271 [Tyrophagus putrescentiae]|nr:hypothetical protein TYRP_009271 [Tyrophagus putrescentiae]
MSYSSASSGSSAALRARLQALLKKHLTAERAKANGGIEAYHQREFIGRLEDIVQRWMVEAVFALHRLADLQLTEAVEEAMISTLQTDLDRHFPLPATAEAVHQLNELYRNVPSPVNSGTSLTLATPKFHRQAYLLPTGALPENATIVRLHSAGLRPLLTTAQEQLWRLSVAIYLLAPAVADSHNTGLAVQRKVLKSIRSLKHFIGELLLGQGWLAYAQQRAAHLKASTTCRSRRRPGPGYLAFERAYLRFLRTSVRDLASELLLLQHTIVQHLEAIKAPRLDHTANLAARILN